MPVYQKKLMDNFFSIIHSDFDAYCERHQIREKNNDTFLTFLYDLNLLNENMVRKYTILEEYQKMNTLPSFQKTKAVRLLADRFQLTDRTVWNMLSSNASFK